MRKLLAVDDIKDNLITLRALMKMIFPECMLITALNGREGIEIAQQENPDIIILDVNMPGLDGYETCKILRENEKTKHIPVLMLTAIKTDVDSKIKGLDSGADAFLSFPIDIDELKAQLKVLYRIRVAENQLREEKTKLQVKVKELEEFNELFVEREYRIKELKSKLEKYEGKLEKK